MSRIWSGSKYREVVGYLKFIPARSILEIRIGASVVKHIAANKESYQRELRRDIKWPLKNSYPPGYVSPPF
jgi:site-specific DNA-adenine methylase